MLVVPPVSTVAGFLLWKKTKLWGMLPITGGLAVFTAFIVLTTLTPVDISTAPYKDGDLSQVYSQLVLQLIVAALFLTGSVGLIFECLPRAPKRQKE